MSQFDGSYAQPTVFDHLWSQLYRRSRPLVRGGDPAWGMAFAGMALGFYLAAAVALLAAVLPGGMLQEKVAQLGVSLAGVAAGRHFLVVAVPLLAGQFPRLARWLNPGRGGMEPVALATVAVQPVPVPTVPVDVPAPSMAERREYLHLLRKAGVNVRIAQALVSAGLDCRAAVEAAGDADILAVHGVGPATLRRLRCQFSRRPVPESAAVGLG